MPKIKEKRIDSQTTVITPAQMLSLNGAPLTVVTAPGAGKALELVAAIFTLNFKTVAYVVPNTDHQITIGGATFDSDAELQALLESASRASVVVRPPAGSTPLTENTALTVALTGTGQPTAGDSNLLVEVLYRKHDVTGLLD